MKSKPFNRERDLAIVTEWARQTMAQPVGKVLILDTETTALNGEVIELGMIALDGATVYNRRFKPLGEIHPMAFGVHGISHEMLANESPFSAHRDEIAAILGAAELVLIYNSSFDLRLLKRTCEVHKVLPLPLTRVECLMRRYATFYGEWNRGTGGYRWQHLEHNDHSAVGDCRAALALLHQMAAGESDQVATTLSLGI